jgi:hypothetical protein
MTIEQDVARLKVAMNDLLGMRFIESRGDARDDAGGVMESQLVPA